MNDKKFPIELTAICFTSLVSSFFGLRILQQARYNGKKTDTLGTVAIVISTVFSIVILKKIK